MRDIEDVIERYALLIRRVIQKSIHRGDDIDPEDIEQEVRLKIWKFLKKGKKVDNLASYIKRMAYSTTIDELRRMMKQRPSRDLENMRTLFKGISRLSWRVSDYSPEMPLDENETKQTIRTLVNTLSEDRKKVFNLYLRGMTIEEISKSLKWDKPRVRHLFYRGIDDLKERTLLRREDIPGNYIEGRQLGPNK